MLDVGALWDSSVHKKRRSLTAFFVARLNERRDLSRGKAGLCLDINGYSLLASQKSTH